MRKGLRHLVVALIAALLLAGTILLARTLHQHRQSDLRQQVLDVLPEAAQRIRDFYRTRVVDGRRVWEVSAREAQYYDEKQMALVREPSVSFFTADGREVALRGEEGKVYLGNKDLEQVELQGKIEVQFGPYALRTEAARYERARDAIIAPGEVRITGRDLEISGDSMTIELNAQRLQLSGNVRMMLRPGA